jgi:hypothetical protein
MKCYTFEFNSGHLGGLGVVVAKTKKQALKKAQLIVDSNSICEYENVTILTLEDLEEVKMGEGKCLDNGNY